MVVAITTFFNMLQVRRDLIYELVRRELRDRHTGQILGTLWVFGQPLLLMLIYAFLFAYVFPARYGTSTNTKDYSACILAGIVPWLAFQDLLMRSSSILVSHANLVKQIVFPIEVLPVKTAIASAAPYLVGLAFVIGYSLWHASFNWFSVTIFWIALCQFVAMTGIAFLLSAIGVFFRDIRDILQVFCTLNLFAQPILYNPYAIPKWLNFVFSINPFSYLIWCWQDALFYNAPDHVASWVILPLGSVLILVLGWSLFQRMQHLFGDIL